jgi:hypothetical protein
MLRATRCPGPPLLLLMILTFAHCKSQSPASSTPPDTQENGTPTPEADQWVSAPDGWTATGSGAEAMKAADGARPPCQPVSYGCNSCCNSGISGNLFRRSDCSYGCAMGCGSQPCY